MGNLFGDNNEDVAVGVVYLVGGKVDIEQAKRILASDKLGF